MRIAHMITRLIIGGAQENTLLTCEDLIRVYGDDVMLITGPALGPEGSLVERAKARGVPIDIVPSLRRAIHPYRDLVSYHAIKRRLRRFSPQVVHTHSGKAGLLGRMAAAALKVPVIVHSVHGAPFHPYQSPIARATFRLCERFASGKCQAIISVADAMTTQLVAAGVAPPEKFTTVYSGIEVEPLLVADEHRSRIRAAMGYRDDHIVVGKVARLFRLKGHEDVIQAARKATVSCPQLRFLFVGDGVLKRSLQQQIDRAGLSSFFRLTGLAVPERIPGLLAAMDIVVHASLREGLARVLPQALLSGKPVVSYDVDGASEVVIPGQTGYLLKPRDVEGMSHALVELANDTHRRKNLGEKGRRRCAEQFDHAIMTGQIRQLYTQILGQLNSGFGDFS